MAAGSIVIDLLMKTGSFETDSKRAEKSLRAMEVRAIALGTAIGNFLYDGVSALARSLPDLVKGAIDSADAMRDLSIRVGVSTETLSAYGFAASQTGTDVDVLAKGLKVLAKNAADGLNPTNEYAKVFKALGIELTDAEGKLRNLGDLLPEIADRFSTMEDGTTKAALAQSLFGRAGLELTEFLNQGADGLKAFTERAAELGLVVDSETATAADDFNDTLGELKAISEGYALHLAKELLPDLQALASEFTNTATEGNKVKEMAEDTAQFLRGLATVAHIVSSAFELVGTGLATIAAQGVAVAKMLGGDLSEGVRLYKEAAAGFNAEVDEALGRNQPKGGQFSNVQGRVSTVSANPVDMAGLANALSNPTASTGAAKLSEAEKAAKALQEEYARLIAQQQASIALFGETTEAATMRYRTEFGDLKDLAPAQKELLLANAQYQDELADTAALEQVWADAAQEQTDRVIASWNSATDELSVYAEEAGRNMQDAFADFLFDPFAEGLDGMLEGFLDILKRMAAEAAAAKIFESLGNWGNTNKDSGGWMGALASVASSFFGGGKASGGSVSGSKLYEVGEGGAPELFQQNGRTYLIPGNDGMVVPATRGIPAPSTSGVGGIYRVEIENKGQPQKIESAKVMEDAQGKFLQVVLAAVGDSFSSGSGAPYVGAKNRFGLKDRV